MTLERPPVVSLGAGLLLLAGACGTGRALRSADREVAEIIEKIEREHVSSRIPGLVRPVAGLAESGPASAPAGEAGGAASAPSGGEAPSGGTASEPAPQPEVL